METKYAVLGFLALIVVMSFLGAPAITGAVSGSQFGSLTLVLGLVLIGLGIYYGYKQAKA